MVQITPFRGTLYNPKKIRDFSKVIAPPYDVISPQLREKLYRKSPYNVVRLDLSQDPDPYESAGRLFEAWQTEGVFIRDEQPAIYFLKHHFTDSGGKERERQGFIAVTRLEEFSSGAIRPHEKTLEGPKADRLRLMLACQAHFSPIFALYAEPKPTINRLLAEHVEASTPLIEATEEQGRSVSLWRITDFQIIQRIQQGLQDQPLLIADGHHRYEASLNYRNHWRAQRPQSSGREAFNFVMAYFASMKDDGLVILPTHRLVRGFAPIPFLKLEEALQRYFYLEPYPKTPEGRQWFLKALKSGGKKKRLIGATFKRDPRYLILRLKNKRIMQRMAKELSGALRELDVTTLHLLILEHILGLSPEEQVKEDVVRYSQDEETVLQAIEKEDYQAAFILNPPKAEDILSIAQGGEKMPQKSTYFYPKLVTGLVINKIDPDEEIQTERLGC